MSPSLILLTLTASSFDVLLPIAWSNISTQLYPDIKLSYNYSPKIMLTKVWVLFSRNDMCRSILKMPLLLRYSCCFVLSGGTKVPEGILILDCIDLSVFRHFWARYKFKSWRLHFCDFIDQCFNSDLFGECIDRHLSFLIALFFISFSINCTIIVEANTSHPILLFIDLYQCFTKLNYRNETSLCKSKSINKWRTD